MFALAGHHTIKSLVYRTTCPPRRWGTSSFASFDWDRIRRSAHDNVVESSKMALLTEWGVGAHRGERGGIEFAGTCVVVVVVRSRRCATADAFCRKPCVAFTWLNGDSVAGGPSL